jgi:hypothetical protein
VPRNILQVARDIIEAKSIATKFYKKMNLKNTISKSIAMKFYKKNKPQKHHIFRIQETPSSNMSFGGNLKF